MSTNNPASIRELVNWRDRGRAKPLDDLSQDQRNRLTIGSRRHAPLVRAAQFYRLPMAVVQRATFVKFLMERGRLTE